MVSRRQRLVRLLGLCLVCQGAGAGRAVSQVPGGAPPDANLSAEQKVDRALRLLEEIEELRLRDSERLERLKEPDRLIREAAAERPDLEKLMLAQGMLSAMAGQSAEAIRALSLYNGTRTGRDDYRGFARIGRIYLLSGMPRQARNPLERARDRAPLPLERDAAPIKARIAMDLASAYLGLNQPRKAIDTASEAQTFAPDSGEIQLKLAEIASKAKAFESAETAVKRAITILWHDIRDDPFDMRAHLDLRRAYQISTDVHEYFLTTEPQNGNHYAAYAAMLLEAAEAERRITLLNVRDLLATAVERNPGETAWKLDLIRREMELGGLIEARNHLRDLLRAEPDNADALALKKRLESPPCARHPAWSPHHHF